MNQALKPVWGLFFILLAVTAVSLLLRASRPDEVIPWRPSYAAAVDEARGSNKRTLVYFTASWCGPCQNLKHTTWADKGVEAALRDFVPVKVDIDQQRELAMQYRVEAVPTFVVLDASGVNVAQWSGASPPAEFVSELKRLDGASVRATRS